MVNVFPLQAFRYNPEKAGDLGKVISPPYDQISDSLLSELYDRHPNNFARIILGKIFETDDGNENRYTRAARFLSEWQRAGILEQEEASLFYAYEQRFSIEGKEELTRRGFVGIMRLEPLGAGVLPHEKTFPKPKADRLNLIRACKANLEHVFFLYDDPERKIDALLTSFTSSPPLLACKDDAGTSHAVRRIADREVIREITGFLKNKQLLIADGHHRYETSLAYQDEMRRIYCGSTADEAPFNFRLGTFVALQDKGLVVLPTHRVVRGLSRANLDSLEANLSDHFNVEQLQSLDALLQKMKGKQHTFGLATSEKILLLSLKRGFDFEKAFPSAPEVLRTLDVFLLHGLILDQLLALPHDRLDEVVRYVRWPLDAYHQVRSDEAGAAFFLNPVSPGEVSAVARAGEKMPHKSTDFYPKLWSGLLFYKMDF